MRREVSPRTAPGDLKAEQGCPVTSPGEVMSGGLCRANRAEWEEGNITWFIMGVIKLRDESHESTENKHKLLFPSETSGAKHGGKE